MNWFRHTPNLTSVITNHLTFQLLPGIFSTKNESLAFQTFTVVSVSFKCHQKTKLYRQGLKIFHPFTQRWMTWHFVFFPFFLQVHANLIVMGARLQAALLYTLRSITMYIKWLFVAQLLADEPLWWKTYSHTLQWMFANSYRMFQC